MIYGGGVGTIKGGVGILGVSKGSMGRDQTPPTKPHKEQVPWYAAVELTTL